MRKEGWLKKQGHFRRNWKRRFFVLDGLTILYSDHTNDRPENAKGSIDLQGCSLSRETATQFSITTSAGKKFLIETASDAELAEWVGAIAHNIKASVENLHERLLASSVGGPNPAMASSPGFLSPMADDDRDGADDPYAYAAGTSTSGGGARSSPGMSPSPSLGDNLAHVGGGLSDTVSTTSKHSVYDDAVLRQMFSLPQSEVIYDSFACCILRGGPVHGTLYVTERNLVFKVHSAKDHVSLPVRDIVLVDKVSTYRILINVLLVRTRGGAEHIFGSWKPHARDDVLRIIHSIRPDLAGVTLASSGSMDGRGVSAGAGSKYELFADSGDRLPEGSGNYGPAVPTAMGMGTGINAYAEAYGSAGAGGAFGGALPPGGPGAMGGPGGFETRSHSNSVYVSGTIKVDDGRSLRRATTTPRRPLVITAPLDRPVAAVVNVNVASKYPFSKVSVAMMVCRSDGRVVLQSQSDPGPCIPPSNHALRPMSSLIEVRYKQGRHRVTHYADSFCTECGQLYLITPPDRNSNNLSGSVSTRGGPSERSHLLNGDGDDGDGGSGGSGCCSCVIL